MGSFSLDSNFSSSHILLLSIMLICSFRLSNAQLDPLGVLACELGKAINICGQGTCKPTNATALHFDCECNPGWKKIVDGHLTFPSCLVPDCTINFECGSETPLAPPPPVPLLPPALNFSDPCGLTWCGDGSCTTKNGSTTGHVCNCNDGSFNLLNSTGLPCFKECYFGGDCHELGFGLDAPSSSGSTINGTSTDSTPPPPSSEIRQKGQGSSNGVENYSSKAHQCALIMTNLLFLVATLLSW